MRSASSTAAPYPHCLPFLRGPARLRSAVLGAALAASLLSAAGCDAIDEFLSPDLEEEEAEQESVSARRFKAVWINARWSGGRTGTPSDLEAVTPTSFFGSLCPASALVMENHSTRFPVFSHDILVISNNCTIPIFIAVCATAGGGGSASGFPECATDPRKTPLNRVDIFRLPGGGQPQPLGQTSISLDINVFFCSDISTFNGTSVPDADSTDCVDSQ